MPGGGDAPLNASPVAESMASILVVMVCLSQCVSSKQHPWQLLYLSLLLAHISVRSQKLSSIHFIQRYRDDLERDEPLTPSATSTTRTIRYSPHK
jgi:hypothetical protein